jgi:autotransporter-associated beta strand protein
VATGGTITVVNGTTFSGDTTTAGAGGTGVSSSYNGAAGSTDGNDLFLMRGVTSTFNITGNNTYTFSPVIGNADGTSNAGVAIDKIGTGTLTLTGNSPLLGTTTVDAGTLVANGALGGTMTVNNGGTLMGDGTIGATTVNSGGTIYPGTVGAPLAISGNFTQASGSTFSAEINPTNSDRINVTGSTQINSGTTLHVVADPGSYTLGAVYTLLTSTGSITGHYSNLTVSGGGLGFTVIYDPHDIELELTSFGTNFATYAQTANQLAVATTLDATSGSATGDYAYVIAQLQTLSSSQLPGAFNQLAGDIYPSVSAIELQTTTTWMQLLSNRLAQQLRPAAVGGTVEEVGVAGEKYNADFQLVSYQSSDGQVRTAPRLIIRKVSYVPRWTGWVQSYGLGGSVAGNGNAGGLNYGLGGSLVGIDRWLDNNTIVGVMGGYAGTSLRDRLDADHATINGGQIGLYQLRRNDRLYLSNVDAFSGDNYHVTRPIDFASISRTATGVSYGNQWAHYTEAGVTLGSGRLMLQPFTGVQYIYLDQHGYSETGAGSLNLSTSGQHVNSVRGNFGGRLYSETTWRGLRVIPSISARYQHEWGNGTQLISSSFAGAPTTSFVTAGNYLGRDFGLFTLGATAFLSERSSLYGAVDTQVSSNYNAVIGSGGFQYRW